ncbi:hypothetical protein AB0M80_43080 [Amycolatopsis sp. NPDC051045]|uniref:hypothetical protein n=1 Tax=Amycolatopsis sp. NPDC051045 TaxID=3156922 RepID=UPI0034470D81
MRRNIRTLLGERMTMDRENRDVVVLQARAALIMAALRRSIVTYRELGFAFGLKDIELRNEMRHVLEQLANECHNVGEPSNHGAVVNAQTASAGTHTAAARLLGAAHAESHRRHLWRVPCHTYG